MDSFASMEQTSPRRGYLSHQVLSDDDISALTCQARTDDMTINASALHKQCPLDTHRTNKATNWPSTGLFDKLSTEIMYMTLAEMELNSLVCLKASNSTSRNLVDTWPPFQFIIAHASDSLRAFMGTGAAKYFTAKQLVDAVCTEECSICGDFGPYIYLLRCTRCCYRCMANERQVLPCLGQKAVDELKLDPRVVEQLPTILTLSRKHFWGEWAPPGMSFSRAYMVDYTTAAALAAPTNPRPLMTSERSTSAFPIAPTLLNNRALRTPALRVGIANFAPPSLPSYLFKASEDSFWRFQAFIRIPIISRKSQPGKTAFDNGRYCNGCMYNFNVLGLSNKLETRMYSSANIRSHLRVCHFANDYYNELASTSLIPGQIRSLEGVRTFKRNRGGWCGTKGWTSLSLMVDKHGGSNGEHTVTEDPDVNAFVNRYSGVKPPRLADESDEVKFPPASSINQARCGDDIYNESQASWCVRAAQNLDKHICVAMEQEFKTKAWARRERYNVSKWESWDLNEV